MRSLTRMNAQIYNTMQGPSEFTVTGNFRDWDRWADLPRIGVPTLLLVGRHDTVAVADVERMGSLIPRAKVIVCENGSHLSLYDDQAAYFDALVPFVLAAHAGRACGAGPSPTELRPVGARAHPLVEGSSRLEEWAADPPERGRGSRMLHRDGELTRTGALDHS